MKKKNLRKIPSVVSARLKEMGEGAIAVGCTKNYTRDELCVGALKRFGIEYKEGETTVGAGNIVVPPKEAGRYSKWNVCDRKVIRRDLPKEPRLIEGEAPNYNGFGTHSISYYRDCYPCYTEEPRHQKLHVEIIKEIGDVFVVAFKLSELLDKKMPAFEKLLLASLNILQENIGRCGVESAETLMSDYQNVLRVDWQFFPPGKYTGEEIAQIMLAGKCCADREKLDRTIQERYAFFQSLGAERIIIGRDSLDGYIGAEIKVGLVVFDNVKYGNAAYIIKGDWQELSKRSRRELRREHPQSVRYVAHGSNWQDGVRRTIAAMSQ